MKRATPEQTEMKIHPAEMERLVETHYANLYRFAFSLVHNEAEAADLTQQTYYLLASRGGQIRDLAKAKSWLFTTLHREFLALKRHEVRFTAVEGDEVYGTEPASLEAEAIRQADASAVMEALARVRETFRVPLALFYLESMSYREISEILQIPVGTVMSRLSRGKEELRAQLSVDLAAPGDATLPANLIPLPRPADDPPKEQSAS